MKFQKLKWLVVFSMLAVILSSCNLGATPAPTMDVGAIQTEAVNQVLTQVALLSSPTPMPTNTFAPTATLSAPPTLVLADGATPIPFNTPLPGLTPLALSSPATTPTSAGMLPTKNGCTDGVFISESAPYDGDVLEPGRAYQKNFTFLNTGSCAWDEGFTFVFLPPPYSDADFKGYDFKFRKEIDFIAPGKQVTFSLNLRSSPQPGTHQGAWKLRDDGGNYFGSMVRIQYVVLTNAQRSATAAAK